MASKKSGNHSLEEAMALLIHNQAAFLSHLTETRQRMAKFEDEIRVELSQIKAILLRHEQTLQGLPEAIREKIGFKPQ